VLAGEELLEWLRVRTLRASGYDVLAG